MTKAEELRRFNELISAHSIRSLAGLVISFEKHLNRRRAPRSEARKFLQRAAMALTEEIVAAGAEETKQHPILRKHAKLATEIYEYLEACKP